ncbi:OmpA family protein [Vibrio mediterranei]
MKKVTYSKLLSIIPIIYSTLASNPALSATDNSIEKTTSNNVSTRVEQLCATKSMVITESVFINQANAIAHNRAQHYQIQPYLSEAQKTELPITQIYFNDNCLEYLNKKHPVDVDTDGIVARVYFNFDSSDLTATSKKTLTLLAKQIKNRSHPPKLRIIGHTDSIGTEKYNLKLGFQRAEASKTFLTKEEIPQENLFIESKGSIEPIRSNITKNGRAANRRVEIKG